MAGYDKADSGAVPGSVLMKPLISVIIPVFNAERTLEICLDSVLQQSYENLEILGIDDGSEDRSPEICDAYGMKDSRVRVFHREHRGAAAARNTGLRESRGEFICFVDADDIAAPEYVQRLHQAIQQSGAGIARCRSRCFQGEKPPFPAAETSGPRHADYPVVPGREIVKRMIIESRETAVWSGLYRRRVLEGLLFEEGRRFEDVLFSCRAYMDSSVALLEGEALYAYRCREAEAGGIADLSGIRDAILVREQRIAFLSGRAPELAELARLELSAEILQRFAGLRRREADSPAGKELMKLWEANPYSVHSLPGSELRVQTKIILAAAKLSVRGCAAALRIRKKLCETGRSAVFGESAADHRDHTGV